MEWLQQNWINLLLLVGVILFLPFSGIGCGFAVAGALLRSTGMTVKEAGTLPSSPPRRVLLRN